MKKLGMLVIIFLVFIIVSSAEAIDIIKKNDFNSQKLEKHYESVLEYLNIERLLDYNIDFENNEKQVPIFRFYFDNSDGNYDDGFEFKFDKIKNIRNDGFSERIAKIDTVKQEKGYIDIYAPSLQSFDQFTYEYHYDNE